MRAPNDELEGKVAIVTGGAQGIGYAIAHRYAAEGAVPVSPDVELLKALGHSVIAQDLLAAGPEVRHDPVKLARAILARVA